MKKSLLKSEAEKQVENFFNDIRNKTPKEIKKIKRFAMAYNIQLKEKRKLFCKKCYSVYRKPKIRIKKGVKSIECEACGNVSRWKL